MNNYIFANLATGKLSGKRGGGLPTFTLGEENPTQIYFLDYPKPQSYSASIPPLGDAFSFSVNPVNKNNSTFSLKAGPAIGQAILDQSSWSNLPNTASGSYTAEYQGLTGQVAISGAINLSPAPSSGVFRIRVPYKVIRDITWNNINNVPTRTVLPTQFTRWIYIPYYCSELDITRALYETYSSLLDFNYSLEPLDEYPIDPSSFSLDIAQFQVSQSQYNKEIEKYNLTKQEKLNIKSINTVQSGDFSFFYSIQGTTKLTQEIKYFVGEKTSELTPFPVTFTYSKITTDTISFDGVGDVQIDVSSLSAPFGKYSNLNFNSPLWNDILAESNSKEIWIEAVLDNKVVSQGTAILRKKLS